MIPDKIYVPTEYADNDITPVGVTLRQVFPKDVCYIRKDALLEWARLGLEMLDADTNPVAQAARAVFNGLIDRLNSM